MRYIVALTGGIGSGKSTVANAFSNLGIDIINADTIARKIVETNTFALKAIISHFNYYNILNQDGTLNRRVLREYIFNNFADRIWLNNLLHPLIYYETKRQILQTTSPYVLWEVPLLVENHLAYKVNRVLVVDTSSQTQLQRTIKRDNISYQHAKHILDAQTTREVRLAIADDIINNEGTPDKITSKVAQLHMLYITLSATITKQTCRCSIKTDLTSLTKPKKYF